MSAKSYEIDMCSGPLLVKILAFTIPIILSGILQLLFNATDVIVVGRFTGRDALAAVGSTSALFNLIINLFIGLSIGVNVVTAKYFGAQRSNDVSEMVHTAVTMGIVCGFFLGAVGFFLAPVFLQLMRTPDSVLPLASRYMRIIFAGMPAMMTYNFGNAVLRVSGDTRRPLYYLLIAGVINVALNLFFVICLKMGVAGVAVATVISNCVSMSLILNCLCRQTGCLRLDWHRLSIHRRKLQQIIKIGVPAGFQGIVFALSNVVIQSAVNSFGADAVAGNTASDTIENFVYLSMNAFYQAAITFSGQNTGARRFDRVVRVLILCLGCVIVTGILLSSITLLFSRQLLGLYAPGNATVIGYALNRMRWIIPYYFLCGAMEVFSGCIRGMGSSVLPMVVSIIGACVLRLVLIATVFQIHRSLSVLYLLYPVSWVVTSVAHAICFVVIWKKTTRTQIAL